MKIDGKTIEGPSEEIVVIPRASGDLVFKAKTVLAKDYEKFEAICPIPKPPVITRPRGGGTSSDMEDKEYLKALDEWAEQKVAFMFLKSISATENLEWDTVKMAKPETWKNYKTELQAANFSELEMTKLVQCVTDANGMNEEKLIEAKKHFLATQEAEQEKQSSQTSEQ